MSKTIIIALLIVSLVGGGAVFAEYSPSAKFLGLNSDTGENGQEKENEAEDEDEERSATAEAVHDALSGGEASPEDEGSFGEIVSERARDEEIDLGMEVSQAARENNEEYDEDESENTDENGNEDDERSDVAKAVHEALSGDPEITPESDNFGEKVSDRARDSEIKLGKEVSKAAREANGSFNAAGNGSPGASGNPGNSGNRGNSGNAGGGKPGN